MNTTTKQSGTATAATAAFLVFVISALLVFYVDLHYGSLATFYWHGDLLVCELLPVDLLAHLIKHHIDILA